MSSLVLKNSNVIDVVTGNINQKDISINEGLIEELGSNFKSASSKVIDLDGKFVLPGLCDAHVHVTAFTADFSKLKNTSPFYVGIKSLEILKGMLSRGFTTVRDAGGADWGLSRHLSENPTSGPRLLFCGHALSQTGGHGDMRGPGENSLHECFCCAGLGHICDGLPEVLKASREEIRRGATHLKVMASGGVSSPTDRITSTQFSEEELSAIVNEANAANIPVMAHAYTAKAINRALKCGVTSIEHGNLLDIKSIELLKNNNAYLVPTLIIYQALIEQGVEAGLSKEMVDKTYEVLDAGIEALSFADKNDVQIVYGTDLLGIMHPRQLEEFNLRSKVISPLKLLQQATINASKLFNMENSIGQVKEGFFADLIVLDKNPIEDISILTKPEKHLHQVIKGGNICFENKMLNSKI
jgi:imidazolonepropionase-like amidohydrolase